MIIGPYIALKIWNNANDPYQSTELAGNFSKLDVHDHTPGKGKPIGTNAISDGAITPEKLATSTLVSLGTPPLVTSLPSGVSDGAEVYYLADATNGVAWHLRYRDTNPDSSPNSSSYKWDFLGGAPLTSKVVTQETISSTSYADITTTGPLVTVPVAGDYVVRFGAHLDGSGAPTYNVWASPRLGSTVPIDTNAIIRSFRTASPRDVFSMSREIVATGLGATNSIKLQYRVDAASATAENRWISVVPVRVG